MEDYDPKYELLDRLFRERRLREQLLAENSRLRNLVAQKDEQIGVLRDSVRFRNGIIDQRQQEVTDLHLQMLRLATRKKETPCVDIDPALMSELRAATALAQSAASQPKTEPSPTAAHLYRGGGMGVTPQRKTQGPSNIARDIRTSAELRQIGA